MNDLLIWPFFLLFWESDTMTSSKLAGKVIIGDSPKLMVFWKYAKLGGIMSLHFIIRLFSGCYLGSKFRKYGQKGSEPKRPDHFLLFISNFKPS